MADGNALDFIDKAVSKWVGLVVLNGGEGSGGRVYEAARSLKAVVKDRAYFLITERVDIAAAVRASGVVLSDQGLPAIVARNTMMDSKSESVFLPLVARTVQTANAALNASSSEGADFLIYDLGEEEHVDIVVKSVFENVKIPIFIVNNNSQGKAKSHTEAAEILKSGASGLVVSLEDLRLFTDDVLRQLFNVVSATNNKPQDDSLDDLNMADIDLVTRQKMGVAGFIKVEDREKQLIEKETSVLNGAISVFQRAAPLMEEISLLIDAVAQIDEPFLLAIVVIVC